MKVEVQSDMRTIRVLIVDDSTVIRRMLSDALSADSAIEIVGVAANGRIALTKIAKLNPDLITLDLEMPEMDGLETLKNIRKLYPKLPVIIFSSLTQRGAETTLEAISQGANDYVAKPVNSGSVDAAVASVSNELLPKIKHFCNWTTASEKTGNQRDAATIQRPAKPPMSSPLVTKPSRVDVVVIGVSTGGPDALTAVLPKMPGQFPVPILVVQHMPPVFTKHLADRLNQLSNLHVHEACHDDLIEPGGVWLAPGNFHMGLRREGTQLKVSLNQDPPENSCRPAVDVLFRSAVKIFGANILSVVMTGMGQDGLRGCAAIREAGGWVVVQDKESSVVWGMPGAIAHAGHAQKIIPLNKIADEIVSLTQLSRNRKKPEPARN